MKADRSFVNSIGEELSVKESTEGNTLKGSGEKFSRSNLVAAVVNMAQPFAQLQDWVASLLRASPAQDDAAIQHGLRQLTMARAEADKDLAFTQFLDNVEKHEITEDTGFQNLTSVTLKGDSEVIGPYVIEPIAEIFKAILGSDFQYATTVVQIAKSKSGVNWKVKQDPGTGDFVFEEHPEQRLSPRLMKAINAIFRKAELRDLITLAASDD